MKRMQDPAQSQGVSDEQLMHELSAGHREALGALYSRYAARIFGLAAQTLGRDAADDIVQDVFVAVWRSAGTFNPERGAFRPWVFQIAHNRILNELRRQRHRPAEELDPEGGKVAELPSPDPEPFEEAWREEERATVRSALEGLPAAQREALNLAFFNDLSHEQVAAELRVPLGTAKTRIRSGLQRLRAPLTPLVAALVIGVVGSLIPLGIVYQRERASRALEDRAVALLTASDTLTIHLSAAPGVPAETHGNYRGRSGVTIAVVGLSHLPPVSRGETYRIWVRQDGVWRSIGAVRPDGTGHAHLVAEGAALAVLPEAIEVTREMGAGGAGPAGPVVLRGGVDR